MPKQSRAAANRTALAELRALSGQPGGPPGALPGRVHGRYATATIGSITLQLFEWEITFDLETFDATAHGERWKVMVAGDQSWTARARGYFRASDAPYLAAAANLSADPGTVVFTGYDGMTINDANRVFQGAGLITRANFAAPMAMVTQEIEIQGSGIPTSIGA